MYIQQPNDERPFTLPRGYRGSAFEVAPTPPDAPPPPIEPLPEEPPAAPPTEPDAAEAFAPAHSPCREGGIFEKIPFLSQLLPPPRGRKSEKSRLPEWAILGIILLLLLDSPENDLLPFLLILLLWD